MSKTHNKEILSQLDANDLANYDAIFLKYYKLLCVNAYFFLKDKQEAKDLVQTFFIELWEKKIYLKLEGDIKGYLYRSIQNRCINYLQKKETNQKKKNKFVIHLENDHCEDINRPDSIYPSLQNALCNMPKKRREALQMVYLQDKKYQEAAEVMGISINSLKTHLKIGLKDLRDDLYTNKD